MNEKNNLLSNNKEEINLFFYIKYFFNNDFYTEKMAGLK